MEELEILLLKIEQFDYQLFSPESGEIKKPDESFLLMVKAILERSEIKNVVAAISTRSETSSFKMNSDITNIQLYESLAAYSTTLGRAT